MSERTRPNILTSIAITPFPGKFAPIPLTGDLEKIIPVVAEIGFDAVEIHVRTPAEVPTDYLDPLLKKHHLGISAFAPGRAFTVDGLSFVHPDAAVRDAAVERVNAFSLRAADYGASVFIGFVRGKVSTDLQRRTQEIELMADCCRRCCVFAMDYGVDILWEPINRYEMDDFNTVEQALNFIQIVGMPNAKLLLDTFHMNIEEPSILDSLRRAAPFCSYIHMVDSNRWAAGFGHTDFTGIAHTLSSLGFSGVFSAEILPLPDPVTAARKAHQTYRRMIETMQSQIPQPEKQE